MLHVGQRGLKYLLDSGASHSFVSADIIRELGLKTHFEGAKSCSKLLSLTIVLFVHVKL